jgi:hypothetical protein
MAAEGIFITMPTCGRDRGIAARMQPPTTVTPLCLPLPKSCRPTIPGFRGLVSVLLNCGTYGVVSLSIERREIANITWMDVVLMTLLGSGLLPTSCTAVAPIFPFTSAFCLVIYFSQCDWKGRVNRTGLSATAKPLTAFTLENSSYIGLSHYNFWREYDPTYLLDLDLRRPAACLYQQAAVAALSKGPSWLPQATVPSLIRGMIYQYLRTITPQAHPAKILYANDWRTDPLARGLWYMRVTDDDNAESEPSRNKAAELQTLIGKSSSVGWSPLIGPSLNPPPPPYLDQDN